MTSPPRIIAGLDPGSAWCGLVIVDASPGWTPDTAALDGLRRETLTGALPAPIPSSPAFRLLYANPHEVGREELLEKFKTKERAGVAVTITHERKHTVDTVRLAARGIMAELRAHAVTDLVVEWVVQAHSPEKETMAATAAAAASMATHLVRAAHVTTWVMAMADAAGIAVHAMGAQAVRSSLTRRQIRGAGVDLDPILETHVPGWCAFLRESRESGARLRPEHVRDALALVLAHALPEPVRERARRASGKARGRKPRRETAAERILRQARWVG